MQNNYIHEQNQKLRKKLNEQAQEKEASPHHEGQKRLMEQINAVRSRDSGSTTGLSTPGTSKN